MNPVSSGCWFQGSSTRTTFPVVLMLIVLLSGLILASGCATQEEPQQESLSEKDYYADKDPFSEGYSNTDVDGDSPDFPLNPEFLIAMAEEPIPILSTPTPEPTSSVMVADVPYSEYMAQDPRQSVFFSGEEELIKTPFHCVYTEPPITLTTLPLGRALDIIHGPFEIRYTAHPAVDDLALPWALLTVRDGNGTVVAEGGYNRQYLSLEEDIIRVYGVGQYHLTLEGGFMTLDLSLYTTDPVPEGQATPVPEYYDEYDYEEEEEEMWR